MKKIFAIIGLLFLSSHTQAQVNIDSLIAVWNDETIHDTIRLQAMSTISGNLLFTQPDTAFYFAQQLLDHATKSGQKRWMSDALNIQGYWFITKADYNQAITYHNEGLKMAKEAGYKRGESQALNNLGLAYSNQGNELEAINYFNQSLKIKEAIEDVSGQATTLINIGGLYDNIGDYVAAVEHFSLALKLCEELGFQRGIIYSIANMGLVYQKMGEYDKALDFLQQGLELAEKTENIQAIERSTGAIGIVLVAKGEYSKALSFLERGLEIAKQLGDRQGIGASLQHMGTAYRQLGQTQKAISLGTEALEIASDLKQNVDQRDAAESLYMSYKVAGNTSKALEMHELYVSMRDSIRSEENQRETIRTEFKREAEQRDNEIALLNLENEKKQAETLAERNKRMFTLGTSVLLIIMLLGGGFFSHISRKQKHQVEITRAELQKNLVENDFLRSQLDPHFIKNALFNIDHLLSEKCTEEAQRYTDSFNKLMNLTLENSRRSLVGLDEELEMMQHYLALEADRLENRLKWSVNVADNVNLEEIELPSLILQPLVENALKHGANMKDGKGEVKLGVRVENHRIICVVEDNGGGIDPEKMKQSTSHGLRITRERLEMFSTLNLADAELEMVNTGNGTRAVVSFSV